MLNPADSFGNIPLESIEVEILNLAGQALKNEEIARQLGYSVDTVKWRLKRIYSVFEVKNRMEAVNRAREMGLLSVDGKRDRYQADIISNPFRGLKTFQPSDSSYFFGREKLVRQIIDRFSHVDGTTPFLALVGPSGIGKSSLINAGLLIQLQQGNLKGIQDWVIVKMAPGNSPLSNFNVALNTAFGLSDTDGQANAPDPDSLNFRVEQLASRPTFIIIDQYEELYSLVRDGARRQAFSKFVLSLLTRNPPNVYVLIVLRADFLDRPLQDNAFGPYFEKCVQLVTPLTPSELEQVILKPSALVGLRLEQGLSAQLVTDVYQQPGALPLLQFVMAELFENRQGNQLTLDAYHELGGAAFALLRQVELIYEGFDSDTQHFTRQLFLEMVAISDSGDFTRRRTRLTALRRLTNDETLVEHVIDSFVAKRILTLGWDSVNQTAVIELAHEALITLWPRLTEWCQENRETLRFKQQIEGMAQEWLQSDQEEALLLSGTRLERAVQLIVEKKGHISETALAFIATSEEHIEKIRQEKEAQIQRELTLRLAAAASTFLPGNSTNAEMAALLAIRSLRYGYSQEADRALLEASFLLYTERLYKLSNDYGDILSQDGQQRLTAYGSIIVIRDAVSNHPIRTLQTAVNGSIYALRQSPDETLLAGGASDGYVYVLEATTGTTFRRFQAVASGPTLTFTPDNRWLFFSQFMGLGGGIWAYDLDQMTLIRVGTQSAEANILAVSADSQWLLGAYEADGARLFNISTGAVVQAYATGSHVNSVALSSDSNYVVTGDSRGLITLWDRLTGKKSREFVGHTNSIEGVAISKDGQYLASGSVDRSARLWQISSGEELRRFTGHRGEIANVTFLPDNKLMTWAEYEHVIRVWDARLNSTPNRIGPFLGNVGSIAISSDGRYLAVSELNNAAVFLLERTSEKLLFEFPGVPGAYHCSVDFSRDGRKLLITRPDSYLEYAVPTGKLLRTVREPDLTTGINRSLVRYAARYSPDGRYILTSGFTVKIARLWNARTGRLVQTLDGHTDWVMDTAFSPDGQYIVTTSRDKTAVVWDLHGRPITRFQNHRRSVFSAAFSSTGEWIVSVGDDSVAWLWNAHTGVPIRSFAAPGSNLLYRVAFADEGKLLLITDGDGEFNIWDLQTGQLLRRFAAQNDLIRSFVVLPDGKRVLTAGGPTINQFDLHIEDMITSVGAQIYNDLTPQERRNHRIADNLPTFPHLAEQIAYVPIIRHDYETVVPEGWAYKYTGAELGNILEMYNLPNAYLYGLYIELRQPSDKPAIEELADQWRFTALGLRSETLESNDLLWTIYPPFDNGFDNRFAFAMSDTQDNRIIVGLFVPRDFFEPDGFEFVYRQSLLVTTQNFKLKS